MGCLRETLQNLQIPASLECGPYFLTYLLGKGQISSSPMLCFRFCLTADHAGVRLNDHIMPYKIHIYRLWYSTICLSACRKVRQTVCKQAPARVFLCTVWCFITVDDRQGIHLNSVSYNVSVLQRRELFIPFHQTGFEVEADLSNGRVVIPTVLLFCKHLQVHEKSSIQEIHHLVI